MSDGDPSQATTRDPTTRRTSIAALRAEVSASFVPGLDHVAPAARELAAEFAYGKVWSRPGFSPRDRSIATIAALMSINCSDQLKLHVLRGLANGISKDEIGEIITQLIPYVGFPVAVSAAATVADVVDRADVEAPTKLTADRMEEPG